MLGGLRHRTIVGRDHEQHDVDTADAGNHRSDESFVTRYVDKAGGLTVAQITVGKPELNRQTAFFLFGQTIGVHAGQCLDEQRLTVIDVSGGRDDHVSVAPGSMLAVDW